MQGRARIWGGVLLTLLLWPAARSSAEEALQLPIPRALRAWVLPQDESGWRWLPAHQQPDGRWSAMDWDRWCGLTPRPSQPRLAGRATAPHDLAATGLSLCAFLGAGYTHRGSHVHARVVGRGLRWLKRRQAADGSFARTGDPDPVTAHAIATLAMTEAFGMTGSLIYRPTCRRALAHLLATRGTSGVWQRRGSQTGDTLATLWACMALRSAELINEDAERRTSSRPLPFDTSGAMARILAWLDRRTDPQTGIVEASPRERAAGGGTLVLTAAGALMRTFAGQTAKSSATLAAAQEHLARNPLRWSATRPEGHLLYMYLGTLTLFQAGGKAWDRWKKGLDIALVETQRRDTDACQYRGSWDPRGPWTVARGRVAATALGSLCLQVFYRYDRVFGAGDAARDGAARVDMLRSSRTWKRGSQPSHAARMTLAGGGELPLDAAHVRADVRGMRAQVVLDLFVTNSEARQHEGVLDLRLPDGAAPYYLAFGTAELARVEPPGATTTWGTDVAALHAASSGAWGRVLEARMAPVEPATEAFERIVSTARDPALLTWSGAGMFHLRVFPLLPGKQHRIVVAYEVDLTPVGDDAELVLALPQDLDDVRIAVRAPGSTWAAEPTAPLVGDVRTWHEPGAAAVRARIVKPGDCWLTGADAAGRAHTAAWVRPDVPRVPREGGRRACFLIDISKSVAAEPMQIWQELLPAILDANRDRLEAFHVGFFDMRTTWWRGGEIANTPENVAALRAHLAALEPGGATDLGQALAAARDKPGDLFLFTDGVPTWGATQPEAVLAEVESGRPIFTYATGLEAEDRAFLEVLSKRSGGSQFTVLGRADIPAAASAHRHRPWLIESVAVEGLEDLLVAGDPKHLTPGQRLRLVGRGRPLADGGVVLALRQGEERRTLGVPVTALASSTMAARAYGQAGVVRLEAAGDQLTSLARDYATHFRVVRKTCALVMLETEADYKSHGLDEIGHAERVAARPVGAALATATPRTRPVRKSPTLAAIARGRRLPSALVKLLAVAKPAAVSQPPLRALSADPVLRALGSALERPASATYGRRQLGLHAYGLGLYGHVCSLLRPVPRRSSGSLVSDWLYARAAAHAQRPLLAILGYEVALGDGRWARDTEVLWVIAADYERYLRRFLAGRPTTASTRFARARLASLERWRKLLAGFAPPRTAALVVLHQPFSWRDPVTVEVSGPRGAVEDTTAFGAPRSNVRRLPQDAAGSGPQLIALRSLASGPWSLRLVRPADGGPERYAGRSLLIVIRDWGLPTERVQLTRSVGPDEDPLILSTSR